MPITLRTTKGSELTWSELDANFTTLQSMIPSIAGLASVAYVDGKVLGVGMIPTSGIGSIV